MKSRVNKSWVKALLPRGLCEAYAERIDRQRKVIRTEQEQGDGVPCGEWEQQAKLTKEAIDVMKKALEDQGPMQPLPAKYLELLQVPIGEAKEFCKQWLEEVLESRETATDASEAPVVTKSMVKEDKGDRTRDRKNSTVQEVGETIEEMRQNARVRKAAGM